MTFKSNKMSAMKVSTFTKEEMHVDQAEFRLLVLISKYARDPWRRSLTSQTDHWGERRMRRVFTINRSTRKMPREYAAVGCAELQTKGSLFSFHTFLKDSSRRKLHPWRFELEIVPSRLPCGHPHKHEFFTKGHRSRIARLSLGWSLVDGTVSLDETSVLANSTRIISRPTKGLKNTFWHLGKD